MKPIHQSKDPLYFFDLKNHLQTIREYRKERKEFHKLHPSWSLYRAKDEFAHEYIKSFHKDIQVFVDEYEIDNTERAAKFFCRQFRGYDNVYGEGFVRRAIEGCLEGTEYFKEI